MTMHPETKNGIDEARHSPHSCAHSHGADLGQNTQPPCGSRDGEWWCVQTVVGQEITADVELRHQGFRVFLPLEAQPARIVPFFPGYLFAASTERAPSWGVIRSTRGCRGVVMRTGGLMPAQVPAAVLSRLWAECEPNGVIYPKPSRSVLLAKGNVVRITGGMLDGWAGIVQQSGRDRVSLLIAELGRVVSVPREAVA